MGKRIYVGNLSYEATEDQVRELFEEYGTVESVIMINDRETGRFRGFCFVEMESAAAGRAIEALDGQRMRIRGFILPTPQKRGIKTFVLVRDNQECCFGPGAALYDCILVEMAPGKTIEFSIWPVAVEGTFSINEVIGPDGRHWAIYRIDGEAVK